MDNSKDRKFLLYLGIGVTLGVTYWAIEFLSNRKTSNAKPLTLEKTRKILQQIKFQILTTCTTFVEGLKNKPKTNHSQQDLEIFYRSELAKVYDMREDTILSKYTVTRDQYAASLNYHKKDAILQQGQKEIIDILQNATKNLFPDYTVPRQAQNLLRQEQVPQVYLEMCELISIKVWQKLDQEKQKNPGFNSKDDTHFKKAIRQISIYDIKSQFLQKKGFKPEWGCPNEVFYKVMESLKQSNKEIKNRATVIEKAYEKIIQRITNQPQHLNAERIKFLFDQIVNNKVPEVKNVPQPQPKPQAPLINPVQNVPKKVVAPVKKDDDFNMDELMMQQLMSRSQEEPKQVLKAEVVPKVEQKPQEKQQVRVQPQQQPKILVQQYKVQVTENLGQIEQKANLQKVREKAVQRQEAAEHQLEANKQQEQVPAPKTQEVVQVIDGEIIAPEKIEDLNAEPIQAQAVPEPPKLEQEVQVPQEVHQEAPQEVHPEAPQVQNNQIQNVPQVQEKREEQQAVPVVEIKEQEKVEGVVVQEALVQDTNPVIQNEVLPEQENEAREE